MWPDISSGSLLDAVFVTKLDVTAVTSDLGQLSRRGHLL
jgi:hypothetical protein